MLPRLNFTNPVLQVLGSSAKLQSISPKASVLRAAIDMIKGRLNALVVMENGQMAGILTERDFLKLDLKKGASRSTLVSDIMTADVTTIPSTSTVQKCVQTMRSLKVRNLPVMEKGEVRTILSMQDISQQINKALRDLPYSDADPTVGDMLDSGTISTPVLEDIMMPHGASVMDAVHRMRHMKSGSLLVEGAEGSGAQFGIFTERDHVHSVVPYDENAPSDLPVAAVARFTAGTSKKTMAIITDNPSMAYLYRPSHITCVTRATKVRDCLLLMLGNGLLYVPVTEAKKPVNVISMRDINLFLAPKA